MDKRLFIALIFSIFFLASASISFAALTVTINSPINNSNVSGVVAVKFNASIDNTTRFNYSLWVDGVKIGPLAGPGVSNSTQAISYIEVANGTALTTAMLNFSTNSTGVHRFQIEVSNDQSGSPRVNSTLITITQYPFIWGINGGPANVTYLYVNNNSLIANNTNLSDATPQINFTIIGDNLTYEWAVWIDGAVNFTSSELTVANNNNTVIAYNLTSLTLAGAGTAGLTNGTHRFQIEIRNSSFSDGRAFFNTTLYTIFIDNQVPTVTITSPVNGTNSSNPVQIYFNVTDGQTTTLTYRIWRNYQNGSTVSSSLESTAVTTATNSSIIAVNLTNLLNGTYTFVVEANDTANNIVNSTPLTVVVDTTSPNVTITSPVNGTNSSNPVQIYFNVTDNFFNSSLTYRIWRNFQNGSSASSSLQTTGVTAATNSSIIAVNLTNLVNGTYTFVVEANDTANNIINSTPLTVVVDTTTPNITITSPVNGTNTSDATPEIYFNVTDNFFNGSLTYRVWTNFNNGSVITRALQSAGVTAATNSSIIAVNLTNLVNGTYTFVVEANDTANNIVNSTPLTMLIDNQVPTVTITSPVNGTNSSNPVQIYFNVTDGQTTTLTYRIWRNYQNVSGVSSSLQATGVTAATNSSIIAVNLTNLVNGSYTFVVEANDTANNIVNSTPLTVVVDTTTPNITITSPVNGTNTSDATPQIYFNVTDNFFNSSLTYRIWRNYNNGSTITRSLEAAGVTSATNSSIIAVNLSNTVNGTYTFVIEANDTANNIINSTPLTVTVDSSLPTVTITSPVNGTNTSDATPEIYFNITDNVATTLTYRIWRNFNNGSVVSRALESAAVTSATNSSIIAVNLSNTVNGTYTFVVEANDSTNNIVNSTPLTVFIDNGVLTISITSPINNTNTSDNTPQIYFNITDAETASITYRVWVNGTLESAGVTSATNSSITAFNISARVNGTSVIVVEANDSAGNIVNSTPLHIIVDNTKPTVTLSVSASSVETGKSITITCSASDDTTVINTTSVVITKPGSSTESSSCGASYSNTGSTGSYSVKFTATDLVGNSNDKTVTFTATDPGSGSSGGGGGGGGGGSSGGGSSAPPAKKSTNIISEIKPDVVTKVMIKEPEIGVKEISIEVNNKAQSVEVTVTKLDSKPASVTREISGGTVYQYMDISQKNIIEGNLKKASIRFKIPQTWLSSNNINENTVVLNRYVNNAWTKLPTVKINSSNIDIEYEAITPGFSVFAVSGEKVSAQAPTTTVPSATTTLPGATTTLPRTTTTTLPAASGDSTIWIFIVFVVVVLALFYFLFMKKKK